MGQVATIEHRFGCVNRVAGLIEWLTDKEMARPEGFEPPTEEVEAPCSIQLSYGRADGGFPSVVCVGWEWR